MQLRLRALLLIGLPALLILLILPLALLPPQALADRPQPVVRPAAKSKVSIDAAWRPLLARMKQDGVSGKDIDAWFAALGPYSQHPMGMKIRSLFRNKFQPNPFAFLRKPPKAPDPAKKPGGPKPAPKPEYLDVMNEASVRKSAEFLLLHLDLFERVEKEYGVDKEVVVALFMTETRLGTYMGTELAMLNLASMAGSLKAEQMPAYTANLQLRNKERRDWMGKTLKARSDWAYKELLALISYCRNNGHNPLTITGSPFGAIGLCQFMPSNIPAYAADGNGDGCIDLFNLDDAMFSIAKYLKAHGWKKNLAQAGKRKAIYRYNHSNAYVNTVLDMAAQVKDLSAVLAVEAKAKEAARAKAAADPASPAPGAAKNSQSKSKK